MTLRKFFSLTSILAISWLAACGSDFSGSDDAGGSGGQASGAVGGKSSGGTNAGKGGKSSGGSSTGGNVGTAGGIGSAGEGVIIGEAGASTGMAGATSGGAGAPTVVYPSCRDAGGVVTDVLFCDNFEDPELPEWSHLGMGDDGVSLHVTEPVHAGSGALMSIKSAQGTLDPVFTDALGEHTSGQLYLRVWMFIPGDVIITADPLANASLLVLGEGPPNVGGVSLAMWANSKSTIQVNNTVAQTMYVQAGSYATPLPRDEWFCLRLDFPIGPSVSNLQFHLRIGEAGLVNSEADKVLNTALSAPYSRLWVGINYISPQQTSPVTVYYDDVVVDTHDIPCD
jgi:hypothetical protein